MDDQVMLNLLEGVLEMAIKLGTPEENFNTGKDALTSVIQDVITHKVYGFANPDFSRGVATALIREGIFLLASTIITKEQAVADGRRGVGEPIAEEAIKLIDERLRETYKDVLAGNIPTPTEE